MPADKIIDNLVVQIAVKGFENVQKTLNAVKTGVAQMSKNAFIPLGVQATGLDKASKQLNTAAISGSASLNKVSGVFGHLSSLVTTFFGLFASGVLSVAPAVTAMGVALDKNLSSQAKTTKTFADTIKQEWDQTDLAKLEGRFVGDTVVSAMHEVHKAEAEEKALPAKHLKENQGVAHAVERKEGEDDFEWNARIAKNSAERLKRNTAKNADRQASEAVEAQQRAKEANEKLDRAKEQLEKDRARRAAAAGTGGAGGTAPPGGPPDQKKKKGDDEDKPRTWVEAMNNVAAEGKVAATALTALSVGILGFVSAASPGDFLELRSVFAELTVEIGVLFLPIIRETTAALQVVVDWFRELSPETQDLILQWTKFALKVLAISAIIGALAAAIAFLLSPFGILIGVVTVLVGIFTYFGGTMEMLGNAVITVINAIIAAANWLASWVTKQQIATIGYIDTRKEEDKAIDQLVKNKDALAMSAEKKTYMTDAEKAKRTEEIKQVMSIPVEASDATGRKMTTYDPNQKWVLAWAKMEAEVWSKEDKAIEERRRMEALPPEQRLIALQKRQKDIEDHTPKPAPIKPELYGIADAWRRAQQSVQALTPEFAQQQEILRLAQEAATKRAETKKAIEDLTEELRKKREGLNR